MAELDYKRAYQIVLKKVEDLEAANERLEAENERLRVIEEAARLVDMTTGSGLSRLSYCLEHYSPTS